MAAEIRAELARQRISQAALSAATGIKPSTLRSRLDGKQPFWLDELDLVAAALNISISEIIRRSESEAA